MSIRDRLMPRATFDLDCPASSLAVRQEGTNEYIVTGCGGEAAYFRACDVPHPVPTVYGSTEYGGARVCTFRAGYIHLPVSAPARAANAATGGEVFTR